MYVLLAVPALALLLISAIWLRTLLTHRNPAPMLEQIEEARHESRWMTFYEQMNELRHNG